MQLSSFATKQLCSAKALRRSPDELVQVVCELDAKLDEVRASIQQTLDLQLPLDLTNPPSTLTAHQAVVIQVTYYALLWDIHTIVTYPWLRAILDTRQHQPSSNAQIELSSAKVIETSRAAILDSKYVPIDANSPIL